MNFHLKFFFTGILLLFISSRTYSQISSQPHIIFSYDDAGNRIKRQYVLDDLSAIARHSEGVPDEVFETKKSNTRKSNPNEIKPDSSISVMISPNPATEFINVNIDRKIDVKSIITVFDVSGKLISSVENTSGIENIDLQPLNVGIYYVRVINGEKQVLYKLIKK